MVAIHITTACLPRINHEKPPLVCSWCHQGAGTTPSRKTQPRRSTQFWQQLALVADKLFCTSTAMQQSGLCHCHPPKTLWKPHFPSPAHSMWAFPSRQGRWTRGPQLNRKWQPASECRKGPTQLKGVATDCGPSGGGTIPGPARGQGSTRRGGGGDGTQKFVYQEWPDQTFPIVNVVFSRDGHFGLEGGGWGPGGFWHDAMV